MTSITGSGAKASRNAGSATPDAVLHATTSSLMRRLTSVDAACTA
jgi:hypothetical protein